MNRDTATYKMLREFVEGYQITVKTTEASQGQSWTVTLTDPDEVTEFLYLRGVRKHPAMRRANVA